MPNIFPKKANRYPLKLLIALGLSIGGIALGITYYCTPKYANVGYQPLQPVAYDHYLHATQLGLDCRYCHTYVDRSEHANIPATSTCMNCHQHILTDSPNLAPVRDSFESGEPLPWVKIHNTPGYVYFNHSVHVNRGISCIECHGEINHMEKVYQAKPLSMSFCLDCHRNPEKFIRPLDAVYNLDWKPQEGHLEQGKKFVHDWTIITFV